ncbi:SPOR domain-containing protein [Polaribacter litorisediminis]|uniref:SPOR domain-containing protein n=1 Tax=Polaribacter litorisediminis TaxID=1908341 RepID=UPI001CBA89C9|nr:SPOR domain-containing protein [Polaribacter litorisediminis]UAM99315.1 SPOR domain-containing protein [Polaribacter litorisediminis]
MKNITTLLLFLVLVFSCTKKETKPENKEFLEPVVKDTILQVDDENPEEISSLIFTVQIAALRKDNEPLSNISDVSLYQEDSLTKYRLGTFETYKEARAYRLKILNTYKGAFVQALKNNAPISITEALQQ